MYIFIEYMYIYIFFFYFYSFLFIGNRFLDFVIVLHTYRYICYS